MEHAARMGGKSVQMQVPTPIRLKANTRSQQLGFFLFDLGGVRVSDRPANPVAWAPPQLGGTAPNLGGKHPGSERWPGDRLAKPVAQATPPNGG